MQIVFFIKLMFFNALTVVAVFAVFNLVARMAVVETLQEKVPVARILDVLTVGEGVIVALGRNVTWIQIHVGNFNTVFIIYHKSI